MDETPQFIRYSILRLVATSLDYLIIKSLMKLILIISFAFKIDIVFGLLANGLAMIMWLLLEAQFSSTPGKWAANLKIEIPGSYFQRVLRLILRNVLKWTQIGVVLKMTSWLDKTDTNEWIVLAVPLLVWLAMILSLRQLKTDRQLHDLLCGSQVISSKDQIQLRQTLVTMIALGLASYGTVFLASKIVLSYRLSEYGLSAYLFKGYQSPKKIPSVVANMNTFQTMLETYAVDHKGQYPPNLMSLMREAKKPELQYWKELRNPFTGKHGLDRAYSELTVLPDPKPELAGMIFYNPIPDIKGNLTLYFIYGGDKEGKIMQDKGRDFYLSNG